MRERKTVAARTFVLAIFLCAFGLARLEAKCEKNARSLYCNAEQVNNDLLRRSWSDNINFYMNAIRDDKLETTVQNDQSGVGIKRLDLTDVSVREIQDGYFDKISNGQLTSLKLNNVRVENKLRKSHFEGISDTLTTLQVTNTEFEEGALDGLVNLRILDIANSTIDQLPELVNRLFLSDNVNAIDITDTKIEDFSAENLPNFLLKPNSKRFSIAGSKMRCDASMLALNRNLNSLDLDIKKTTNRKAKDFICSSPPELAGKHLGSIPESTLANIPIIKKTSEKKKPSPTTQSPGRVDEPINKDNQNQQESGRITADAVQPSEGSPDEGVGGIQKASAIGISAAFGVLIFLIILAILIWLCCRNKRQKKEPVAGDKDKGKKALLSKDKADERV